MHNASHPPIPWKLVAMALAALLAMCLDFPPVADPALERPHHTHQTGR